MYNGVCKENIKSLLTKRKIVWVMTIVSNWLFAESGSRAGSKSFSGVMPFSLSWQRFIELADFDSFLLGLVIYETVVVIDRRREFKEYL